MLMSCGFNFIIIIIYSVKGLILNKTVFYSKIKCHRQSLAEEKKGRFPPIVLLSLNLRRKKKVQGGLLQI
jgi:hypothetical protein